MPARAAETRRGDFLEVNEGFPEEIARKEAKRCLECGCHDFDDCKLIYYAQKELEMDPSRVAGEKHPCFEETDLVCIERTQGKCITCNLCVRVCDEEVGAGIIGLVDRGFPTVIRPEFNDPKTIEICKTCLKCVEACPTGTLRAVEV